MQPNIVGLIQARMGSTRLPGKTLADIVGRPLLAHIIDRVRASETMTALVVATTILPEDQPIEDLARSIGVGIFRGSEDDVLDRFYQAARVAGADIIVRLTADDPFKDPVVLDHLVRYLLSHPELDYVSNTIEPTYPEGLDIEIFTFAALERAWQEARLPSEREHVTSYIWKNPTKFRVANLKHHEDLSHLRWTLDYEEDLIFTRRIYAELHQKRIFLMDDILTLLRQKPELTEINAGIARNVGYLQSLAKDL